MASKKQGRRGNSAPIPPLVHKMLKEARLDDLAAYARRTYGLALDPASGPEAMKAAIQDAAKARAAQKAQQEAQHAPQPAAQQSAQQDHQPVVVPLAQQQTVEEARAEVRKAEIAALPKDPWITAGRKPGKAAPVSGVYNDDGVLLPPDTDPVLTDEEWVAELNATNPEFVRQMDPETQAAIAKMPEHLRPKPVKAPFRHPTRPCIPKAFLNQDTGVLFRPTEILMRNPRLTPVYHEPPLEAVYGT